MYTCVKYWRFFCLLERLVSIWHDSSCFNVNMKSMDGCLVVKWKELFLLIVWNNYHFDNVNPVFCLSLLEIKWNLCMIDIIYNGRVPACGVFCGGCPNYTRIKKPCKGAEYSDKCERCKTFHLCCKEKGITHCFQCRIFPCSKFKSFTKRWLKYGQNIIEH